MADENSKKMNPKLSDAREHIHAARKAWHKSIEELVPRGFVESRRTARKEALLALRSMIDAAIEHSEESSKSD